MVYFSRRMGEGILEFVMVVGPRVTPLLNAHYASMDSRNVLWWRKRRLTKGDCFFAAVIIVDFRTRL